MFILFCDDFVLVCYMVCVGIWLDLICFGISVVISLGLVFYSACDFVCFAGLTFVMMECLRLGYIIVLFTSFVRCCWILLFGTCLGMLFVVMDCVHLLVFVWVWFALCVAGYCYLLICLFCFIYL